MARVIRVGDLRDNVFLQPLGLGLAFAPEGSDFEAGIFEAGGLGGVLVALPARARSAHPRSLVA